MRWWWWWLLIMCLTWLKKIRFLIFSLPLFSINSKPIPNRKLNQIRPQATTSPIQSMQFQTLVPRPVLAMPQGFTRKHQTLMTEAQVRRNSFLKSFCFWNRHLWHSNIIDIAVRSTSFQDFATRFTEVGNKTASVAQLLWQSKGEHYT